jgi:MoxR-like ATPase
MAVDQETLISQLENSLSEVVLGKHEVIRLCVVALLAGEHVLLEDVPGVGKTLIGKALAKSVSGTFRRVQFTPDLLPADITGSSHFDSKRSEFVFTCGPIFANIVLADEINRTTPRTQSALLEAMSERQVSVDGTTHSLERPFMVIATQNPLEFEGTYPLPESQLDRFLLRISVGYPERDHELQVLLNHRAGEPVDRMEPVLTSEQVESLQQEVRNVRVDESINEYLLDVVHTTRECEDLQVGVSIRGALSYYRACQALAMVEGRDYVVPDDVKHLAVPVLAHRVVTKGYLHGSQREALEALIGRLVDEVPVPS